MANVHASIKQIRKDEKKRIQNQAVRSELHTLWKKFVKLVETNPADARGLAHTLTSQWDRAVSRGIVPKGRADRKKARLAGALKQAGSKSR